MLNINVFKEQLDLLKCFFPNWEVNHRSKYLLEAWYPHFENMNDTQFIAMIDNYIKTQREYPTVRGLLKCNLEKEEYSQC